MSESVGLKRLGTAGLILSAGVGLVAATLLVGGGTQASNSKSIKTELAAKNVLLNSVEQNAQLRLFQITESKLAQECMEQHGFKYIVEPEEQANTTVQTPDGYGLYEQFSRTKDLVDTDTAVGDRKTQTSNTDRYLSTLSTEEKQRYRLTLSGDPTLQGQATGEDGSSMSFSTSGCVADARTKIYGDFKRSMELSSIPRSMTKDWDSKVKTYAAYKDALSTWRSCMADAGFKFSDFSDAHQALESRYAKRVESFEALHDEEVKTANADKSCREKSDYDNALDRSRNQLVEDLTSTNKEKLAVVKTFFDEAANRANAEQQRLERLGR